MKEKTAAVGGALFPYLSRALTPAKNMAQFAKRNLSRALTPAKTVAQFAKQHKGVGLVGAGGLLTASGAVPLNPSAKSPNSATQAYARAAEQKDNTEWATRHGKDIFDYAAGGLGIGVGATGLYYLLQAAQNAMKAPKKRLASPSAPYSDEEEKEAFDLGTTVGNVVKSVGMIPQRLATPLPTGADPNPVRGALATTLGVAGGVAGLYGGNQLINSIMENKQTTDVEDEVEDAKKHYYDVLTGGNKRAAALDTAYAAYASEKAAFLPPGAWDTLNTIGMGYPNEIARGYSTAALLSALAAGTVGAKYMYDRTRERSKSQNLAKARAHLARMSGTPSVWVDPSELAQVKQLANQNA
jgi:hypothetical protein